MQVFSPLEWYSQKREFDFNKDEQSFLEAWKKCYIFFYSHRKIEKSLKKKFKKK